MNQLRKDFKLIALTESEALKNNLLKLLNPWVSSPSEGLDFSHQAEEEKHSLDILIEKPQEFAQIEVQIQHQGKIIKPSIISLDSEKYIGEMLNADGILLVFNETEEGAVRLQDLLKILGKSVPEKLRRNIMLLLLKAKNEDWRLDVQKIPSDVFIDERNVFRYSGTEDDQKIISSLLDKIVEEPKGYFLENTNTNKLRIKKGFLEKPVMAVWKKEEFLKSFQKRRQFSRKLFYFNYSHMPTEENFEIIKKSLVKSKFLREVDLDFTETQMVKIGGDEASDKIFKKLSQGFRKLNSLKVLKFKTGYQIGDRKLEYLADNCKHLSSLETLNLRYEFNGEYLGFPPGHLLSYAINKRNPLKHIHLSFNIEEFDISPLASTLKRLSTLESVHLDLRCSTDARATEGSWKQLSKSLKEIPLLRTFKFRRLHQPRPAPEGIADLSLRYISETVAAIDSLTEISLDFNGNIINNESVICLSNAIRRQHSLQKLTLLFANCEKLTNDSLIHLSTSIAPLNRLNSVFLNFNFCYDLDDTFLNSLENTLVENLTSLQSLKLWIIWCQKMSEEAVENFEEKLKNKKSLKDLDLRT